MLLIGALSLLICLLIGYFYYRRVIKKKKNNFSNRWNIKNNDIKKQKGLISNKLINWLKGDSILFLKLTRIINDKLTLLLPRNQKAPVPEKQNQDHIVDETNLAKGKPNKKPKYLILKLITDPTVQPFYEGYELYQAILSSELKLSSGGAFAKFDSQGNELFKLVPATTTGVFKNNAWGQFRCKGLILYMDYPKCDEDLLILKEMWHTAQFLVDALGGAVTDENNQPFALTNFQY